MIGEYYIAIDVEQFEIAVDMIERGLWFRETDLHIYDNETLVTTEKFVMESVTSYFRYIGISYSVQRRPHFMEN
jgi:hypothetical protein